MPLSDGCTLAPDQLFGVDLYWCCFLHDYGLHDLLWWLCIVESYIGFYATGGVLGVVFGAILGLIVATIYLIGMSLGRPFYRLWQEHLTPTGQSDMPEIRGSEKLRGVHPHLVKVVKRAAEMSNRPFRVLEGTRSPARQQRLKDQGKSRTLNSRHLVAPNGYAHAVDIAPLVNDKVTWDWDYYHPLAAVIKRAADEVDVPVEWGGDWRSFPDGPHWQLPWKQYPSERKVPKDTPALPTKRSGQFDRIMPKVFVHEGGYVDHPRDPGGATNYGISLNFYRDKVDPKATPATIRNLSKAGAKGVYREHFWNALRCGELPAGVDYAVFDWGVNSGINRPVPYLQRIVGVRADGVIGPVTLEAVHSAPPGLVIERLCDARLDYLKSRPNASTFIRGWTKRVEGVRKDALAMVSPAEQKAQERERVTENVAIGGGGTAGAGGAVEAARQGVDWVQICIWLAVIAALAGLAYYLWKQRKKWGAWQDALMDTYDKIRGWFK